MSLSGWLDPAKRTFQSFVDSALPEEFLRLMSEGGDGTLLVQIQHAFSDLRVLHEASALNERVGFGSSNERTYVLEFRQPFVFGVLLLDSFAPPDLAYEQGHPILAPVNACITDPVSGIDIEYDELVASTSPDFTCTEGSEVNYDSC